MSARTPAISPRLRLAGGLWLGAWLALAVIHLTQAIWLNHGVTSPGDLADGRFNQLVLEHGYQSLRGTYSWIEAGQFYPVHRVLAFSDTHAGTLPFYAPLRAMGFSIERAWQGWVLVCSALDVWAASCLLRALGCERWLRGPLSFALASSAAMVWAAGAHMQLLPAFPGLFALAEAVRWLEDRSRWRALRIAGWLAWQFAAGPYLAFFFVSLGLSLALSAWMAARLATAHGAISASDPKPSWKSTLLLALIGVTLAWFSAKVYWQSSSAGMVRSMEEVTYGAPDLATWFSAPPSHLWWRNQAPAHSPDWAEHALFPGLLPWIGTIAALAAGWKWRRERAGTLLLAWSGGVIVMVVFFTKWGSPSHGLWLAVAEHFSALRAFRSCARIVVIVNFALVASTALVLSAWARRLTGRRRILPIVAACLVAFESLAHHQAVFDLTLARQRAEGVIDAWHSAGDRPVLAYAYGYSNQPAVWMHLDAWSAALRTGRKTMNGYSGLVPTLSWNFYWNPTPANVREVEYVGHVDPATVSVVEALPPEAARRIGLERLEHQPVTPLEGFSLQPIQWKLFGSLERHVANGHVMYQFTPPAEIHFAVPDSATRLEFVEAMRAGSYDAGGQSDGVGITWLAASNGGEAAAFHREMLNPREQPADRGLLRRTLAIPAGTNRTVILRVDQGPANDGRWDWPLFGELRTR